MVVQAPVLVVVGGWENQDEKYYETVLLEQRKLLG